MLRLNPYIQGLTAALLAAGLLAACAAPTPLPGAFETAVAGTVEAGGTAIAQGFSDQRATLTAAAPTATNTPAPTVTPSETPVPTETPTPAHTATPSPTPTEAATATNTRPPPPTATFTPSPLMAGTYASGTCITMNAFGPSNDPRLPNNTRTAGLFVVCVPTVVIRPSMEMQINVTWLFTRDGMHPDLLKFSMADHAILLPYNGSVIYLQDNLGRQVNQTALEGAAKDGGLTALGTSFSGYYLFPAAQPGATTFTLVDTHRKLTINNITLGARTP